MQAARTTYMVADGSYYIFKQIKDILIKFGSKYNEFEIQITTYQKLHVDYLVI